MDIIGIAIGFGLVMLPLKAPVAMAALIGLSTLVLSLSWASGGGPLPAIAHAATICIVGQLAYAMAVVVAAIAGRASSKAETPAALAKQ
ncbi:MAG: hypothetical protein AAF739_09070 [Pseudomonadota bacterium]